MTRNVVYSCILLFLIVQAFKEFTSPSEPLSCSVLSEGDGEKGPLLLGELYHGPTMTFKDLALSVTARQTRDAVLLSLFHGALFVRVPSSAVAIIVHVAATATVRLLLLLLRLLVSFLFPNVLHKSLQVHGPVPLPPRPLRDRPDRHLRRHGQRRHPRPPPALLRRRRRPPPAREGHTHSGEADDHRRRKQRARVLGYVKLDLRLEVSPNV